MSKVMVLAIGLALALGKVGYLRKATLDLAKRALYTQQHEMISLVKLSRALNGETNHIRPKSKH